MSPDSTGFRDSGKFHKTALYPTLKWFNTVLYRWGIRKYKGFKNRKVLFFRWLKRVAKLYPALFEHWKIKGVWAMTAQ